ncbi:MAG TPA: alpha/beta fold hydrolase [Aliidongia sp.]|nr:alpha/beta fold hydrolase [Aliidongia sp.]
MNSSRCFHAGTDSHPIYVDHVAANKNGAHRGPVVLVHGACHTGACYLSTPDGRPGWVASFAAAGFDVFVPDWPGHGRSPMRHDFATLSTVEIAESLLALLEEIGPAVLVVHSASGPMAWWLAERRPDRLRAIIGVAPGAPANLLAELPDDPEAIYALRDDQSLGCPVCVPEDRPVWAAPAFMAAYWANAPRFPRAALSRYQRSVVPESARVLNERFNIGGRGLRIGDPAALRQRPILIITGDNDPRHPRAVDAATADYLGAEFIWLPDRGITGNGHMLMIEDNSDDIAAVTIDWLATKGL